MVQERTLLLIDDEQDVLDLVRSYLSSQGFHVITTPLWTEAIAHVQEASPDIVLLDLSLPTVQGETLLEFIREHDKDLPVIIVSSAIDAQKIEELGRLGANGFIRKPFEADDLLVVIEQALIERESLAPKPAIPQISPDQNGSESEPETPVQTPIASSPSTSSLPDARRLQERALQHFALPNTPEPRRRRTRQPRAKKTFKRVWTYLGMLLLFVLIALVIWLVQKQLSSGGLFGIGV